MEADVGTQRRVEKQRWRARKIESILKRVVRLSPQTTVLEIGAAFGEALALLRERHGCRVLGVEPSEHTRQYARSKNRIELVARRIEDLHSSGTGVPPVLGAATSLDGLIDVVIMSHVLENVVHPRRALAAVRRALRADGVLYIDTCNFYYNNAVNPYHPYVFSPETLADLLARCGFDVVRQFGEPHPRRARWPSDPYLVVIARPAQPSALARAVEVAQLVADQDRGIRLRNEFKQRRAFTRALCAAIKRLTHGPSYSTYGD